jgi:hypothetical protein
VADATFASKIAADRRFRDFFPLFFVSHRSAATRRMVRPASRLARVVCTPQRRLLSADCRIAAF